MKKVLFSILMLILLTGCSITINTNDSSNSKKEDNEYEKSCCLNAGGAWKDDTCGDYVTYDGESDYESCILNK